MTEAPSRPILRWLGGKWRLAPWIISHLPPHRIYVEPFGGAASVLLRKSRAYNEVYNDLDGELVNLFKVLRSERADELVQQLRLTPYARNEYEAAFELHDDPVERARRTVVRSQMAHGTGGARIDRLTGFRVDGRSGTTNVAGEWRDYPSALSAVIDRIQGVSIQSKPALQLIDDYDSANVLLYLDPPYLPATRSGKSRKAEGYHTYAHELSIEDHAKLLDRISQSSAMIVLSGYPDASYDERLSDWHRVECSARAHRNSPRTEVLWINPAARAATPCTDLWAMGGPSPSLQSTTLERSA